MLIVNCPLCDGTGWKPIDENGVRRVVRCDCWRERSSAQALEQAGIPARYAACEFSTFVTYPNDRLLNAVASAKRFAEAFPVVEKGLLVIGPPGIREDTPRDCGNEARHQDQRRARKGT